MLYMRLRMMSLQFDVIIMMELAKKLRSVGFKVQPAIHWRAMGVSINGNHGVVTWVEPHCIRFEPGLDYDFPKMVFDMSVPGASVDGIASKLAIFRNTGYKSDSLANPDYGCLSLVLMLGAIGFVMLCLGMFNSILFGVMSM